VTRVLVAGVGNVLFGDDGFGCEVARVCQRDAPAHVDAIDFGVRGYDLAYALTSGLDAAILVDAMPRGGPPGTIYVVDPAQATTPTAIDGHAMHAAAVLEIARQLGPLPSVRVVGCEPARLLEEDAPVAALSDAVREAVPRAASLALELAIALATGGRDA
jgi:hydrogenase maturation protease